MNPFKLSWIRFNGKNVRSLSFVLIVSATMMACATYSPRGISLLSPSDAQNLNIEKADQDSALFQKQVFNLYCSAGKQIRAVRTNVKYISPKVSKGLPLNISNQISALTDNKKQCFLKESFRRLSTINTKGGDWSGWHFDDGESRLYNTKDSPTDIIAYAKSIQLEDRTSAFEMQTYFVVSENPTPIYMLFGFVREDWTDAKDKIPYYPRRAYLSELHILTNGYTMLVPPKVQATAFPQPSQRDACDNHEHPFYYKDIMGYDRDGNPQLADALSEKDDIWGRYFRTYTTIKESVTSDPQITDYEISLNLNQFCQYARSVSDLTSK